MNEITNVTALAAASLTAVSQQTLAALQTQMLHYTPVTGGGQVNNDYKALEYAIETGNISAAQAALSRLRRDSQIPHSIVAPAASKPPSAASHAESVGEPDEVAGPAPTAHAIDITA